MIVEYFKQDRV